MWNKIKDFTNDVLGKKHEAVESLSEALKERSISPFYGYFLISWLLINWDYIYTALLVDQNLIFTKRNLLRIDYLLQEILPPYHSWIWLLNFIIFPFILTCIVFWVMPFITKIFYRQHLININRFEKIRLEAIKKNAVEKTEVIKEKVKMAEEAKRAESVNPEINWEIEFDKFKQTDLYKKFNQISDSFYKYDGQLSRLDFEVDTDILIYSDSHGLINLSENQYGTKILSPTEKGRYYFRKFIEDPSSVKTNNAYLQNGQINPEEIPF